MAFLNSISLRNKILLVVGLVLASMVAVTVTSHEALQNANERARELQETYKVIDHTHQMEASL